MIWEINGTRIQIYDRGQLIKFKYTRKEDKGDYSCQVYNKAGMASKRTKLLFNKSNEIIVSPYAASQNYTNYYILVGIILILLSLLILWFLKIRSKKLSKEVCSNC